MAPEIAEDAEWELHNEPELEVDVRHGESNHQEEATMTVHVEREEVGPLARIMRRMSIGLGGGRRARSSSVTSFILTSPTRVLPGPLEARSEPPVAGRVLEHDEAGRTSDLGLSAEADSDVLVQAVNQQPHQNDPHEMPQNLSLGEMAEPSVPLELTSEQMRRWST